MLLPINLILGVLSTPPKAKDTAVRYTLVSVNAIKWSNSMRLDGQASAITHPETPYQSGEFRSQEHLTFL